MLAYAATVANVHSTKPMQPYIVKLIHCPCQPCTKSLHGYPCIEHGSHVPVP